ncbi:hypothetical protein [Bacillus sp. P14.5]|uniref:hypothetical protein n=1 Tax=Bacillus sp. P14.5 TaxID=1983400 RepID=UPI000DE927ED|nr:hypothetical protein [Bacillus sp. P14.5]
MIRRTITNRNADLKILNEIEAVKWQTSMVASKENSFIKEINADLKLHLNDKGPVSSRVSFTVVKTSPMAPWKVDESALIKLLKERKVVE